MSEIRLSPEQQVVVDTWDKGLAVMAGAGSGKTTTLVLKCAELIRRKPDARFAAVSFTERSASDLRAKLAERLPQSGTKTNEGSSLSGHWVMTIHGLCGAILREYPREAGYDGDESMLSEAEVQLLWERAMEGLWFDELPLEIQGDLDKILAVESRAQVLELLRRVRQLHSFGVLSYLRASNDGKSKALETVFRYVFDRYDRLKRRRGVLDFDDLERGADRALENPAIREAFHRRFDLVMVDEFQDTNPVQASIIKRFCKADLSNLCVVGDPKQSIYRFRDADVSIFEEFCSRLPVRQSLTWNFRSRPAIIDYSNQLCEKSFKASEMLYEPLVPKREAQKELDSVIRLDIEDPSTLAVWIQSQVNAGVPLHEMALLLRKIRGNERWLKALTAAGVPIAIGSGGLFWEDARVRELAALLKWWDNPGHTLSGAIFLRAPWVGIPDKTLDQWNKQDKTWQKPFFASDHPLARVLAPLVGRILRPAELLTALLINEAIENELGSALLGLWHRCEELSSRGLDFHSVVTELTTAMEESRRERDVPPPKNLGQLSVLTLHGSKGLEFPHVILVDLGKKGKAPNAPLLFWDREKGVYLGARDPKGERLGRKDPEEAQWRDNEAKKNLAESKRLFYVALTRARERLVLVCPKIEATFEPETVFLQDDWRGWVECSGISLPVAEIPAAAEKKSMSAPEITAHGRRPSAKPLAATLTRPRHSVTEWNLLVRCPRSYEWTYIRPRSVVKGIPEIGLFMGDEVPSISKEMMTQAELGTRVHGCLEKGDFDGLKHLEKEVGVERFLAEPLISWALSSDWMAPPRREAGRDVWPELAFEVPIAGEVLVGSIDRLVLQNGKYTLIDFKVTEKAKSVEALLEAYQTQLELYAWALMQIEPEIKKTNLETLLVNISAKTIQAVPVSIEGKSDRIESLARVASEIVKGQAGSPKPGRICRFCEFRSQCPEGMAFQS